MLSAGNARTGRETAATGRGLAERTWTRWRSNSVRQAQSPRLERGREYADDDTDAHNTLSPDKTSVPVFYPCKSAPQWNPGAIRFNGLILLNEFRSRWGPDRRRSGPHPERNSRRNFKDLVRAWAGVPLRCRFTRRFNSFDLSPPAPRLKLDLPLHDSFSPTAPANRP